MAELERKGVLGNTIVIITGDHGESLGEHGEETHEIFIYDSTIRVPLIFSGGPIAGNKHIQQQVGLIDIFPTIADILLS